MTRLVENQKIKKRTSTLFPPSQARVTLPVPYERNRAAVLDIKQTARPDASSIVLLILTVSCLAVLFLFMVFRPFGGVVRRISEIELPSCPQEYLNSMIIGSVGEDYNGQGSGDIQVPLDPIIQGLAPIQYNVKKGDSLSEIAMQYDVSVGTLISFNNISDVRALMAGTTIKIPNVNGVLYEVKAGDSIGSIAAAKNVAVNDILDANNLASSVISPGQNLFIPGAEISDYEYKKATGTLMIYPTQGRISSPFGYRNDPFTGVRRFHYGLDIANSLGTPIRAAMGGRVVDVGNNPGGFGKYVIIQHSYGYQTLYGHLNRITVAKGQTVAQNEKLGEMGTTGRSTGPHLHFQVYKNLRPVDPMELLYKPQ